MVYLGIELDDHSVGILIVAGNVMARRVSRRASQLIDPGRPTAVFRHRMICRVLEFEGDMMKPRLRSADHVATLASGRRRVMLTPPATKDGWLGLFSLADLIKATIDDQRLTSDEPGVLACQKGDRTDNVLRLRQSLDRLLLPNELFRFLRHVGRCRRLSK